MEEKNCVWDGVKVTEHEFWTKRLEQVLENGCGRDALVDLMVDLEMNVQPDIDPMYLKFDRQVKVLEELCAIYSYSYGEMYKERSEYPPERLEWEYNRVKMLEELLVEHKDLRDTL